ncbi:hypothetical protein KY362_03780 [Candidatus Woesearchaeota archaeon]|nr:hypothetical protein [Candidatus Woesearchaeota archaeon]
MNALKSIENIVSESKNSTMLQKGVACATLGLAAVLSSYSAGCRNGGDGDGDGDIDGDADVDGDADGDGDTGTVSDYVGPDMNDPDRSIYRVGDVFVASGTVSEDPQGDSMTASVEVIGDTDGSGDVSDGDFRFGADLGTVVAGQTVVHQVNTGTDNGGEAFPADPSGTDYTIRFVVTDSTGATSTTERTFTLEGIDPERARVAGCYVSFGEVGTGLTMRCIPDDPQGRNPRDTWGLSGTYPADAFMNPTGEILTAREMTSGDVRTYEYRVRVLDSDESVFRLPVDEWMFTLVLRCDDGTVYQLRETNDVGNTLCSACSDGRYNPSRRPMEQTTDSTEYAENLDPACVRRENARLHPDDLTSQVSYNDGETVEDAITDCESRGYAIEFGEGRWGHR